MRYNAEVIAILGNFIVLLQICFRYDAENPFYLYLGKPCISTIKKTSHCEVLKVVIILDYIWLSNF